MLFISGASDKITAQAGTAADLDFQTSSVPYTATGVGTPIAKELAGVTATTVQDIVDAAGASTQVNVRHISCRNKHASAAPVVTFRKSATATVELFKVTLQPGWTVVRDAKGVWFVYDANGGVVMGATAASQTAPGLVELADSVEMEAATDLTRAVAPGVQHRHPGHPKAWAKCIVSAGVPALTVNYGVTSITDTGTGQLTLTMATAFSSANWAVGAVSERASTTMTSANIRVTGIRNATQTASAVQLECWDQTATTAVLADPAAWHFFGMGDQ